MFNSVNPPTDGKIVYKPAINGNKVTYRDSKGQNITTIFHDNTLMLPQALSETVSGRTPDVSKTDLIESIWKRSDHLYMNNAGIYDVHILERAEKLVEHYAEKISEGEGRGIITQKEQFEMMELWHKWFGFDR